MIWLALSVAASLALALVARAGEQARQDRIAMMAWNYAVATALTGAMAWAAHPPAPDSVTVALGAVTGLSYAAALLFWMIAIPLAGLGMSTTAMRLSVVCPALVAVLAYGERPTALQALGLGLALAAIGLLLGSAGGPARGLGGRGALWLSLLWLSSGSNAVLLKVFTASGRGAQQPVFLALIFAVAGAATWALALGRSRPWRRGDLVRGAAFGACNVAANAFLLRALEDVPAVVVFPVRDAGIITTVGLAGVLLLRERPGPFGYAALGAATLAVVCMSV